MGRAATRRASGIAVLVSVLAAAASAADGQAGAEALVTPPGVRATLFAAEPLLSSPADIDVDARGRVWVCVPSSPPPAATS